LQQLAQSLTPYLRELIDKETEEIAEALDNHLLDSGFAAGLSAGGQLKSGRFYAIFIPFIMATCVYCLWIF